MLTQFQFTRVGRYVRGSAWAKVANGSFVLLDTEGRVLVKSEVEPVFFGRFALITVDGKTRLVDESGRRSLPVEFDTFWFAGESVFGISRGGHAEIVDRNGRKLGSLISDPSSISEFHEGLAILLNAGRYGYIRKDGKFAIRPIFDDALPVSEGMAAVQCDGKWGYVCRSGKWAIHAQFDEARSFHKGIAVVMRNRQYPKWSLIDRWGRQIGTECFDSVGRFQEGYAVASNRQRYGLIDLRGNWVIKPQYTKLKFIGPDKLKAARGAGEVGIIDCRGNAQVPLKYWDVSERTSCGLRWVQSSSDGCYGYVNEWGKLVIPCKFDDADDFDCGLGRVAVEAQEKWATGPDQWGEVGLY